MDVINRKFYAGLMLVALFALFIYGLGAILTPFVTAALLAYLGDPLADRLEKLKLGRSLSVSIVFLFLFLILLTIFLLLGPMLGDQVQALIHKLPQWIDALEGVVMPILNDWGVIGQRGFDQNTWKEVFTNYWQEGGNLAFSVAKHISSSGAALLGFVTNLILIPVLTFYLLRDWDIIVDKMQQLLPMSSKHTVVGIFKECDEVLSAFLRGQFVVMLTLAVLYSIGLSFVGLELALLIGTIAGLTNIIPYMGFVVGIISALIAAWMQFQAWLPLVGVGAVFAIGQMIEGMVLTPSLVGDKIGLHPVAVIFALMAGAQLGGFVGLLLALPIAAVFMVLVRYFVTQYKLSQLYQVESENALAGNSLNSVDEDVAITRVTATDKNIVAHVEEDSVFDEAIWMKKVDS